VATMFP